MKTEPATGWTDEMKARYRALMDEGLAAAAARRTPELELEVARRLARLGPNLCNVFCGPDNGKGRQEIRVFTPEEVAERNRQSP